MIRVDVILDFVPIARQGTVLKEDEKTFGVERNILRGLGILKCIKATVFFFIFLEVAPPLPLPLC